MGKQATLEQEVCQARLICGTSRFPPQWSCPTYASKRCTKKSKGWDGVPDMGVGLSPWSEGICSRSCSPASACSDSLHHCLTRDSINLLSFNFVVRHCFWRMCFEGQITLLYSFLVCLFVQHRFPEASRGSHPKTQLSDPIEQIHILEGVS